MARGFDDVPLCANGEPLPVASDAEDYWRYLDWLADYLYRPGEYPGSALSCDEAERGMISIESDIACAIWDDPYEDYPPPCLLPPGAPQHADYLHREEMARILSRVPDHADRLKLLDRFYRESNIDASK